MGRAISEDLGEALIFRAYRTEHFSARHFDRDE